MPQLLLLPSHEGRESVYITQLNNTSTESATQSKSIAALSWLHLRASLAEVLGSCRPTVRWLAAGAYDWCDWCAVFRFSLRFVSFRLVWARHVQLWLDADKSANRYEPARLSINHRMLSCRSSVGVCWLGCVCALADKLVPIGDGAADATDELSQNWSCHRMQSNYKTLFFMASTHQRSVGFHFIASAWFLVAPSAFCFYFWEIFSASFLNSATTITNVCFAELRSSRFTGGPSA